jgi:hypothetical protein
MSKPITAGSEVDAYCTKCKLDLGHRVIAMDGAQIKRVECLTCRGHHNYRRPKSAARPTTRATKTKRTTARKAAQNEQRETWEQAVQGRSSGDFTEYTLAGVYEVGELLRHKKFGDGVVLAMLEDRKMQVAFEEGPKTLVYGR